jgi:molybdopterin-binding protein
LLPPWRLRSGGLLAPIVLGTCKAGHRECLARVAHSPVEREGAVPLSASNQLKGTVKSVKMGTVMAEVVIDIGGQELVSAITAGSAHALSLTEGKEVIAIIKATEVLVSTDT